MHCPAQRRDREKKKVVGQNSRATDMRKWTYDERMDAVWKRRCCLQQGRPLIAGFRGSWFPGTEDSVTWRENSSLLRCGCRNYLLTQPRGSRQRHSIKGSKCNPWLSLHDFAWVRVRFLPTDTSILLESLSNGYLVEKSRADMSETCYPTLLALILSN